jgi:hypothetical protein
LRLADLLQQPGSQHRLIGHIEELILDGGTPGIDDENVHEKPLVILDFGFWIHLIADCRLRIAD